MYLCSRQKRLADHARGRAKIVALIVDADDAALQDINKNVAPDLYQAHGSETPQRVLEISALTGKPVIKAIKVGDLEDIAKAADYAGKASLILYDAKAPETLVNALPGGNGWLLTGTCWAVRGNPKALFSPAALIRKMSHRPFVSREPPLSMSHQGLNRHPAKRIWALFGNSLRRRRPPAKTALKASFYDDSTGQFLPHRPR